MPVSIFLAVLDTFLFFTIGWLARRFGYLLEADIGRLSRFFIDFLFPALVFATIIDSLDVSRVGELWPLPFIGFGMMAAGALAGFLLAKGLKTKDEEVRKTFRHFCAMNNYGFLPIVIIGKLWGDEALANLFFLHLGSHLGFWTIGIWLLGGGRDPAATIRNLLSPPLIGLFLALVLAFSGLDRFVPEFVLEFARPVGDSAVPLVLMMVGATLYGIPLHLEPRDMLYLSVTRLFLLPLGTVLALALLPIEQDVYRVSVVVAIMPVSVTTAVFAMRYGGSPGFAARAAVITTILSIITIPLWLIVAL